MATKDKTPWNRRKPAYTKPVPSRDVLIVTPGRPETVVAIGNVRARVWLNDGRHGAEWKIDVGYVYSTGGNNPHGKSGFTNSIPLNSVPDAAKALKKAYRCAMRGERKRRLLAIVLFRW